jgi:hypothetical protein
MQPSGPETPIVLVKWYDYAKWLLERVENFPKSQRFVLGQRLANQAMEVMDLFVEAPYAREKTEILALANRRMEVLRWTVRMAKDRKLFTTAQFEFSARALNECGRMVGGWIKSRGGGFHPPSETATQLQTPTFVTDWPLNEWVSRFSNRGWQ